MDSFNNRRSRGRTITEEGEVIRQSKKGRTQKYDERKSVEIDDKIEKIVINSTFVDINVYTTDEQKVESHFYGEAEVDEKIKLDIQKWNHELIISVRFTSNCYNGLCKFDVYLPRKIFRLINIQTLSADVTIDQEVSADNLEVRTQSGNVNTNATFMNTYVRTRNGYVKLKISAEDNIDVAISTINGDIDVEMKGIKEIKFRGNTSTDNIRCMHEKGKTGYTAKLEISTVAGDIVIR